VTPAWGTVVVVVERCPVVDVVDGVGRLVLRCPLINAPASPAAIRAASETAKSPRRLMWSSHEP
jgi:hypothetical protein